MMSTITETETGYAGAPSTAEEPSAPLRIVMLGARGLPGLFPEALPPTFGGIEQVVQELGAALVRRGHEVTVQCRQGMGAVEADVYNGVGLEWFPTVRHKHLEAFVHAGLGTARRLRDDVDILHYHALGPGFFTPLARFGSSAAIVQTIHGLDTNRAKWGPARHPIPPRVRVAQRPGSP